MRQKIHDIVHQYVQRAGIDDMLNGTMKMVFMTHGQVRRSIVIMLVDLLITHTML